MVDHLPCLTAEPFVISTMTTHTEKGSAASPVAYDLLGEITEKTQLTRRTAGAILGKLKPSTFAKYRRNPEPFTETARLINEQKATVIVEHLTYDTLAERYDTAIFTDNQTKQDFTKAGAKLTKHIYGYVVTDSKVERNSVTQLDTQHRGRRLRQAAAGVLHPNSGRRLQPRLGHHLPRRDGQTCVLRRRDQGLAVLVAAQGRRAGEDRVRP
jgi:hypothetical protein